MLNKKLCSIISYILVSVILMHSLGAMTVAAIDDNDVRVTATTYSSVKQGNSGYCYVYIDSLESLATLSVTVHYDLDKVILDSVSVYNTVSCTMYDKAVGNANIQFSYIFDGNGVAEKTQLFYFSYTILSDAEVGDTYFDIVINEAYDSSLNALAVRGSRCDFTIAETVTTKTCSIYSSSSIPTSVGEEFDLSYRLSTYQIASGSFSVHYDPELFEVVGITKGAFCDNKIVDVNTNLVGAVYVSFVGTEYGSNTDLITVKFKTLKNVADTSSIEMTITDLYDLDLNSITCSGYTTKANVVFDESYTEDAPSMSVQAMYDAMTDKVTLAIKFGKDSRLGAGDFVLKFDTIYITYASAQKAFSPTFFNINNKNVETGVLKFSIISLSDITDEVTVLTAVFDVNHACEDKVVNFEISGSGLTDSLTNPITVNFIDSSVTIPLQHIEGAAVEENRVEPTYTTEGSYDSVVYCSVCHAELSRESKTLDKLGRGVSLSGQFTVEGNSATPTIVKLMQNGQIIDQLEVFGDTFCFMDVAAGTYDLVLDRANHLPYTLTGIPVGSADMDLTSHLNAAVANAFLPAGDINEDNSIDLQDVALLTSSSTYSKSYEEAACKAADVNGDGKFDLQDLAIVTSSNNYGKSAPVVGYTEAAG